MSFWMLQSAPVIITAFYCIAFYVNVYLQYLATI